VQHVTKGYMSSKNKARNISLLVVGLIIGTNQIEPNKGGVSMLTWRKLQVIEVNTEPLSVKCMQITRKNR